MSGVTQLVLDLKEKGEDFEFYPTSKEMIFPIWSYFSNNYREDLGVVLDIGAGTCNFKKYYNEFSRKAEKSNSGWISDLHVIEKSKMLIQSLPEDTIVVGTDFDTTALHDKKADTIFCNPPYSEFQEWTYRILHETTAKNIFMIIPRRWKENNKLSSLIEKAHIKTDIIGEFDFLTADRKARAIVDVVHFRKSIRTKENNFFEEWFDENIGSSLKVSDDDFTVEEKKIVFKNQIAAANDKSSFLVECYNDERRVLQEHFKAISTLDEDILKSIGVSINSVKSSLREKLYELKNKYWYIVFDELEEIKNKLTKKYRKELFDKFKKADNVDFTEDNIYCTVLWILKNANKFYDKQLLDFYRQLSDADNVSPYKSNQDAFRKENWRWSRDNNIKYNLDYRLICSHLGFINYSWSGVEVDKWNTPDIIDDIAVVARNLGFHVFNKEIATEFGKKYYIFKEPIGRTNPTKPEKSALLEYKIHKNGNTHIKMDIEFSKAFNVEASRLLGWIRSKEDIKKDFNLKHLKDCEKYYKSNIQLPLNNQLMLG